MRDRARAIIAQQAGSDKSNSESESAMEHIVRLAKQHGEIYPVMVDIMNHYGQILQRDINLFVILHMFVLYQMLTTFTDS
jgi:diaphanous 1